MRDNISFISLNYLEKQVCGQGIKFTVRNELIDNTILQNLAKMMPMMGQLALVHFIDNKDSLHRSHQIYFHHKNRCIEIRNFIHDHLPHDQLFFWVSVYLDSSNNEDLFNNDYLDRHLDSPIVFFDEGSDYGIRDIPKKTSIKSLLG